MKRYLSAMALVAAAMLSLATSAKAQTVFNNVCSAGSFKVCASANVFIDVNGDLVMQVWNNNTATTGPLDALAAYATANGGHHTIFEVGLDNIGPITVSPTGLTVLYKTGSTTSTLSNWVLGAKSIQLKIGAQTKVGHVEGIVGCYDPDLFDGTLNKLHVETCGSYPNTPYVEFRIAGLTSVNLDNAIFGFHSAQVADASCVVTPENLNPGCLVSASLKGGGPNTVTPEPITLLLLGSGLAGVGALRRRKRHGKA